MINSTFVAVDRLSRLRTYHQKVVQLWIFLGCILGFLTLVNLLCILRYYFRKRLPASSHQRKIGFDEEKPAQSAPSCFWARFISMLVTTYRVVAFRVRIPVGFGGYLLLSETMFIGIYLASLLTLLLVDSMPIFSVITDIC